MKALLIDPTAHTVSGFDFPGGSDVLAAKVGQRDIDFASMGIWDGVMLTVVVAGDGYFRTDLPWWRFASYGYPLAGKGVIYGADPHGETVDVSLTAAQAAEHVRWLDARPELPPVTVNGVVVADFNGPDAPQSHAELFARIQKATMT